MIDISAPTFRTVLRIAALAISVFSTVQFHSCKDLGVVDALTVPLKNADLYEYATVGGDEDGARITRQAVHYEVSEIRRDKATNFIAVYMYRPKAGYVGTDYVEIEIRSGSDGTSPPSSVKIVGITFVISN